MSRIIVNLILIFILVILSLGVISVKSVLSHDLNLDFTVQSGLNMRYINWNSEHEIDIGDSKFSLGFAGGVTVIIHYPGPERFALQTGVIYQGRGGKIEDDFEARDEAGNPIGTCTTCQDFKLSYLTIPVLARFSFGGSGTKIYFKAGPEWGILLTADLEYHLSACAGSPPMESTEDIKEAMDTSDLGLLIGTGVQYPLGSISGFSEINLSYGFTDITRHPDSWFEYNNRTINLTTGIRF